VAGLLEVSGLRVAFGPMEAVRGASFTVAAGEVHGLVGESGCGKSATALALMGLLPRMARRTAKWLRFDGQDLTRLSPGALNRLRGERIGMVFQEPMTSLNPAYTVASQMTEVWRRHRGGTRAAARERAAEMLGRVGIASPGLRLGQYPHELSGGLRQRVMIATSLLCGPALLIADEPTTALDVTIQVGILRLLLELQAEAGLAVLLITHDLGVVARMAHRVSVMYAGQVVESGPAERLFRTPAHPYTRALLDCVPVPGRGDLEAPLGTIPGVVPRLPAGFPGCAFRDRCPRAAPECAGPVPVYRPAPGHAALCLRPL